MAESPVIAALRHPAAYEHPVDTVQLVETHISWVLLTGSYAYKIKKPVDFGFLDFSTLEKRHFFCQEELRLNRRLAPDLYLEVTPITGNPLDPRMGGSGPIVEYAVKMRQFDEMALGDRLARNRQLRPEHIDGLAESLAAFHDRCARSGEADRYGVPEVIETAAENNFIQIRPLLEAEADRQRVDGLRTWTQEQYERLKERMATRKQNGFIRECHGDLHLGNLVLLHERLVPFDCIEFSQDLRWIDVISELAFIMMDLEVKGLQHLAFRLLNHYLEITGDYSGIELLNYYRIYRALVRAKIACLTRAQTDDQDQRETLAGRAREYMAYAEQTSLTPCPWLVITHGYSGSGKSHIAALLSERLPAIHLRSDVERKRLAGFTATATTDSRFGTGIYTEDMTRQTYIHLLNTAERLLTAGFSVIVDATFLDATRRQEQCALAQALGAQFAIVSTQAPEAVLRQRIRVRLAESSDASEADIEVLERQIRSSAALADAERDYELRVDTSQPVDIDRLLQQIMNRPEL